jgi:hypothetical protein
MTYACFRCRYRHSDHEQRLCPQGHVMQYVYVHLPASRDDHKMWRLAEEKSISVDRPRRRKRLWSAVKRDRRRSMADWERQLLRAAK